MSPCIIDTLVTRLKSWTLHPHAGVLVVFEFLFYGMHTPSSVVGSCVSFLGLTQGQCPSELPWQDQCRLCCLPEAAPSPGAVLPSPGATLLFLGLALPFSGAHGGTEIAALLCLAPATLASTSLEAAATIPSPALPWQWGWREPPFLSGG